MNYDTQRNEQEGRNSQNTSQAGGDSTKSRKGTIVLTKEAQEREVWTIAFGMSDSFQVSSEGRLRSLDRVVYHSRLGSQFVAGRIMACGLDTKGYPRVMLHYMGSVKSWAIHRLVMASFVPRDDWKEMQVNHKDGVRNNNSLNNLEWCTNSENRAHSYRVLKRPNPQLGKKGPLNSQSKPVIGVNLITGERREYPSLSYTEKDGFKPKGVSACLNKKRRSHKGWEWEFVNNGAPAPGWRLA